MFKRVLFLLMSLFFSGMLYAESGASVKIENAFIREMAPGQSSAAAYCRIFNASNNPVYLTKIDTLKLGVGMIHQVSNKNGMVKMHAMHQLLIPAHDSVSLAPGHQHIMFSHLTSRLKRGEQYSVSFYFNDKRHIDVIFPVRIM